MKYRTIITFVAALFTTQAFSSKWELKDEELPPSNIILLLKEEKKGISSRCLDLKETPSDKSLEKTSRIFNKYNLGYIWGDAKIYSRPNEVYVQVFQFNRSGSVFFINPMEEISKEISETLEELSTLRKDLKEFIDKEQYKRINNEISCQEKNLDTFYALWAKESKAFKEKIVWLVGEVITQEQEKAARH